MKTLKEIIAYTEAQIECLKTCLRYAESNVGGVAIILGTDIANDIRKDLDEMRLAWLTQKEEDEVNNTPKNMSPTPTKPPHECVCGDCLFFHGTGDDRGECYAQKNAPTVEMYDKSCDMFEVNHD